MTPYEIIVPLVPVLSSRFFIKTTVLNGRMIKCKMHMAAENFSLAKIAKKQIYICNTK
jgi:hypothetical protein